MADAQSYNLVEEPWIRVRYKGGGEAELSLFDVFRQASAIERLSNDLPTQDFAIMRILLAVLQRACLLVVEEDADPADTWFDFWGSGLPLEAIEQYLSQWKHRFDLFDEKEPFMQVAGMHTAKNEASKISKIIADIPDGKPFFTLRTGKEAEIITYSEAARWLVHAHAFDVAGIKSGVVGDPHAKSGKSYSTGYPGWAGCLGGVYIAENTLEKTLLANLILWDSEPESDRIVSSADAPVWEREPLRAGDENRLPKGRADVFTWQSRRALLEHDGHSVVGVLLTNGSKLEPYKVLGIEPMTTWRRSKNKEKQLGVKPVYLPATHTSDRLFWQSLTSVLAMAEDPGVDFRSSEIVDWIAYLKECRVFPRNHAINMHATGIEYGTQNSVISALIDDELLVNTFLIGAEGQEARTLINQVLKNSDEAAFALGMFDQSLRIAAGDDGRKTEPRRQVQKMAYYELDALFRSWVAQLSEGADLGAAELAWNKDAHSLFMRLGDDLVRNANPRSMAGHNGMTTGKAESIFRYKLNQLFSQGLAKEVGDDGNH